jgi:hypothetical protein
MDIPPPPPESPPENPGVGCQLASFPTVLDSGPPSRKEPWIWYFRRRGRNAMVLLGRLPRMLRRQHADPVPKPVVPPGPAVKQGDRVRVLPPARIRATLDSRNALHGCCFAIGMYDFCGREMRVVKVVEHFFDEALGRMLKGRNLVLLEGAHCDGSISHHCHGCDRMCFYFWRTEWLEQLPKT